MRLGTEKFGGTLILIVRGKCLNTFFNGVQMLTKTIILFRSLKLQMSPNPKTNVDDEYIGFLAVLAFVPLFVFETSRSCARNPDLL